MPLVRISLRNNITAAMQRAIADGVHEALVSQIGIPQDDRFQIIEPRPADAFVYAPQYLGIEHRDVVFVQIALVGGRSAELKQALYRAIADELAAVGVRREDVVITLMENSKEDWSIGNGEAQLLDVELLERHGALPAPH
ncbi:tautomerase family protein [Nocardia sp. CWNU-33]|uniref:tautomerase family protein n=1 Tax=Nocardia sp. CWNU-33 TaxID=3392117 RepID=UPI00398EF510